MGKNISKSNRKHVFWLVFSTSASVSLIQGRPDKPSLIYIVITVLVLLTMIYHLVILNKKKDNK